MHVHISETIDRKDYVLVLHEIKYDIKIFFSYRISDVKSFV